MREGIMANEGTKVEKKADYIAVRALTHDNKYYYAGAKVKLTAEEAAPFLGAKVVKLAPAKEAK
jgi:hypothetical protein